MSRKYLVLILFLILLARCAPSVDSSLFVKVPSTDSKVYFSNDLSFTEEYNPYTFKSFLNGGGVAIGDINNDGLEDLYLTGNLVDNKMYLNKGNLEFEDITDKSLLACAGAWSTGAAFVDINHDGFLDLYVCKSGKPDAPLRKNQFFINNGEGTFKDRAAEYGMDFMGLSVHSAFFDYDKDGDLDCYLLNNSLRSIGSYDIIEDQRLRPDPESGNKLLKNMEMETGVLRFVDVAAEAGIYNSEIGFGLGVSTSDINGDGWDDIYVSNDFFEKDYLYLNNQDGTFNEVIDEATSEISMGSMGADIADLNNDGLPDIFVTEMLPEKLDRYKSKTSFDSYDKSALNTAKGYHRQYGRNVLQINQGKVNGVPQFFELGRYFAVEATDWSWGALVADFDQNGRKDIFIANGIYKDLLDQDHINFYSPSKIRSMIKEKKENVVLDLINGFPSEPLDNYLYLQDEAGNLNKLDMVQLDKPGFSNGSAYADLDNDGDLELVVNNIAAEASIYKNNSNNHWLKIKCQGTTANLNALGAKATIYTSNSQQTLELHPMRGFQSCVSNILHFGLDTKATIDSLIVRWPDLKLTKLYNLLPDSLYTISYSKNAVSSSAPTQDEASRRLLSKVDGILDYAHVENRYADFDRIRLLIHKISNEGPHGTIADMDGDGRDDIVITASTGYPPRIYLQKDNRLVLANTHALDKLIGSEITSSLARDLDGNDELDLVLSRGGGETSLDKNASRDVIVYNPLRKDSRVTILEDRLLTSSIIDIDINGDKNIKLLALPRIDKQGYGRAGNGLVYSLGEFGFDLDKDLSMSLEQVGMVKDAVAVDLNGDKLEEVIVATEFSALQLYEVTDANLNLAQGRGLDSLTGLWNNLSCVDIDNDNDLDVIATNIGMNNRFHTLGQNGLHIFVSDFDNNERVEAIYCIEKDGGFYPIHLMNELMMQMPKLKKKSLKFNDYAEATLTDLVGEDGVSEADHYTVNELRSGIFVNTNGQFEFKPLPKEVQWSEQKIVWSGDLNNDGWVDLIMGGNQYEAKPELGINAASFGTVLINDKSGNFEVLGFEDSGFFEKGQIRDILSMKISGVQHIIVLKNSAKASVYKLN